jgi:diguanylate cyclase (GGDEF)-like protein
VDNESGEVDAQTGAYLRAHFEKLVESQARSAKKSGAALALVWVDVDELTEANDTHGREKVDAALGALAQRLSDVLDGKGPIGRVRGGAFAALLPGITGEQAVVLAEKVRVAQVDDPLRLRVSCGVASLEKGEPFGNLLDAAENACIRAKQGGRDAVAKR